MADTVAGLMNTPKYAKNIYRTGDLRKNAPYTVLKTDVGGTTVVLPLPLNLGSQMGADWQQEGVSTFKYQAMHNKEKSEELLASRSWKDIITAFDGAGGDIIRGGNKDVKAIIARSRGTASTLGGLRLKGNPRNEMLFQGMPFKSFSFNFNLVPYRKEDSESIKAAIKAIQLASAPAMRGEKMFMEYPNTWFIEFHAGDEEGGDGNRFLMKLNECACTGVNVNYTPQGDSSNLHKENAPIAVELGLEFSEIFIPTKETIEEGYNG